MSQRHHYIPQFHKGRYILGNVVAQEVNFQRVAQHIQKRHSPFAGECLFSSNRCKFCVQALPGFRPHTLILIFARRFPRPL